MRAAAHSMPRKWLFWAGSYTQKDRWIPNAQGEGISLIAVDPVTGAMRTEQTFGAFLNPSYLAQHRQYLLVCSELFEEDGSVSLCEVQNDAHSGKVRLHVEHRLPGAGKAACHITFDAREQRVIYCAYLSGMLQYTPLANPCVKRICYQGSGPNAARQEASHPHQAVCYRQQVFVPDLGADCIWVHDRHTPGEPQAIRIPAGYGPRHMVFHPVNPVFYVVCELQPYVLSYRLAEETGQWARFAMIATEEPAFMEKAAPAAIKLTPDGKQLLVSNRFTDSIVSYAVNGDDTLAFEQRISLSGQCPRDFAVTADGAWLLVALQDSHEVLSLAIDTRRIARYPAARLPVGSPSCIIPYAL